MNPFTKEPIVIPARPERTTRCELDLDGAEVKERWSWFEGAASVGEGRSEVHSFPSREDAEVDLQEVVMELLHEGFRELTLDPRNPSPSGAPEVRSAPVVHSAPEDVRELSAAIVERCRERGWFGADMALQPNVVPPARDAVERKRFRYPPATPRQVAEAERLLGFPLPPSLRAIYSQVANGGFGPGYGFVGVAGGARETVYEADLATAYRKERELSRSQGPFVAWPRRVLRLLEWGCNIASCIDARTGRILRYEPDSGVPEKDMTAEADSLQDWLRRWLRGEDLFRAGQR